MILMPIFNNNSNKFSYTIALDGIVYGFSFYFNTRSNEWFMDILDSNREEIKAGIKMVVGYPMLGQWRAYSVPPGDFVIINATNTTEELGFDNFGNQYLLTYLTASEIASGQTVGIQ